MIGWLLGTSACRRRLGGAIPHPVNDLVDYRKESPDDGVFRQRSVCPGVGDGLAEAVGEQDEDRVGTGALQVGEDIAMLPPMKSGAGDDDVGCESGGSVGWGISPRRSPDHPKAGMTVEDVLDETFERRGLYRDQDARALHAADLAAALERSFVAMDASLARECPAFDWRFALVGRENTPRRAEFHLV
jgi:hypothetical protein